MQVDEVVDFEGQLVKLSELKELAQLNSAEALAGPAEDESTIAPAEADFNQPVDNLDKGITSNNAGERKTNNKKPSGRTKAK